jgi:hypothetical protein
VKEMIREMEIDDEKRSNAAKRVDVAEAVASPTWRWLKPEATGEAMG